MIKYFIESPDGRWLTDPQYPEDGWITDDPFKAWAFNGKKGDDPKDILSLWKQTGFLLCDMTEETGYGDKFLWNNQDEECLEGYRITRQEFINEGGNLVHRRNIYNSVGTIDRYEKGPIIKNFGNVKEVYLPSWDGPLDNFFKPSPKPDLGSYSYTIFNI